MVVSTAIGGNGPELDSASDTLLGRTTQKQSRESTVESREAESGSCCEVRTQDSGLSQACPIPEPYFPDCSQVGIDYTGNGATTVIRPDTKFRRLARNRIRGRSLASPARIEGALLLRTDTHLIRIQAER